VNEHTWQSSVRLFEMLAFVQGRLSDRKQRLFAVACCGRHLHRLTDERSRKAVETASRLIEGQATEEERWLAADAAFDAHIAMRESRLSGASAVPWSRQAELLSHAAAMTLLDGNYYGEDAADYVRWALAASGTSRSADEEEQHQCRILRDLIGPTLFRPVRVEPAWRAASDGAAGRIATWIHEQEAFDELPFLADALEDAGCDDLEILEHARAPGEHVRGCWVVDLVLAR
jgi:hypothetical protein